MCICMCVCVCVYQASEVRVNFVVMRHPEPEEGGDVVPRGARRVPEQQFFRRRSTYMKVRAPCHWRCFCVFVCVCVCVRETETERDRVRERERGRGRGREKDRKRECV